ncbi:sushi domain-containing protein 6-like isoform X1 [Anguilla anguilla]|uniref:sushi domain-containing protein 6-like isoform X1 n=1 Tax=Anguilla anguilla TaxID=7936 RepID=UPI0015B0FC9C|nr:sushi domain-containing protein 6-like isoform X1 [Anguilla anguilla]XP_035279485.1 sushi domain-containing protein 6-like isoform X1 [Anguilla anguilla]
MCDGMVAAETRASVPTSPADRLLLSLLFFLAVVSPGQASECVRPPSVQHSWVNLTETNRGSFPLGTLLQYSCDSGYMLDGPSTISCTASGRWSADPPHCVRTNVCRKPFEPENGGYTCHPSPCHRLTPGTVIEYFCDEGYVLKGDYKYLTCQNGEWDSPMQISCVLDTERGCARPPSVQHSWVNLTETNRGSFPLGTLLQYSCDSGYMLDGPSTISCTASGRWSADPPHCVRTNVCRPPFEPENGGYTCHPSPCHRLTQGTVIEYFCDEGYALKGDYKYLTCQNGEWDSPMQISCHPVQERDLPSPLGMPTLPIVASTASSVALILLLVVLFVLLQPKLKSFQTSRREQGVPGQPVSIVVEGVQVSLPSYEEAVYGSGTATTPAPPSESRVQIVLSEGAQGEGPQAQAESSLPSTSSGQSEMVLVHQVPSSSSCSSSSSSSWAPEQAGASGPRPQRRDSYSGDEHCLLSLASVEDLADDIPLLKEA